MTPEQVLETSIANVSRARNHIDDVEWSAEDGTRSEMDFLCRIVEAVIKAGATTVNIPDTVGYTVPEEYTHFMRTLIERVPNSDKAVFSVRWPASPAARGRSNAPSTASASGQAMPRSRKS
jgi:2-isopropylmalate synthase